MENQQNSIAPLKATLAVMFVVGGFIFSNTVFAAGHDASASEAETFVVAEFDGL